MTGDPITLAFELGLGPWLTPLRGKVPVLDAWPTLPPVDEPQVREWVEIGYNLGLRTGSRSGVVVIDDDQAKHAASGYTPPPTGLVVGSPTGGRHYYYRAPTPCHGNSASKLAPHVDVRGEGGQVVFAGSAHPAGGVYRIVSAEAPAELPTATLAVLCPPPTAPALPQTRGAGYARTALLREVARVRSAGPGMRNDALNRAAFSLGQLIAGGALDRAEVESELVAAAKLVGDGENGEDKKIASTLQSGLTAGMRHPRRVPERPTQRVAVATRETSVLVPGSHTLPTGEYVEIGNHVFCSGVLHAMPEEALYRRAGVMGELLEPGFVAIDAQRLRSVIDQHVRLGVSKAGKDDETPRIHFRACPKDLAAVVLAYPNGLRQLDFFATHPVYVGSSFELARPGWNPDSQTYLASGVPDPLDLPTARAVLDDLVCDFPFASAADRANFYGLLLTPMLRPALGEPVPMHLIGSPVERSGKTKLAEVVLGCAVLGTPTPAMQLGDREEEREKRITSLLLAGSSVVHLDNLTNHLDSPALASLLTSATYQGRVLGASRVVTITNGLTVVGTGNNVHATGEVAKRIVPILLQPGTVDPETRQDYRHPLLRAYVESVRERVLGALLGLVEAWRAKGRPLGSVGFGGFERWSAVLGGIMRVAGYPEWLSNMGAWRGRADEFGSELTAFALKWHERYGSEWVRGATLYDLAVELGLFGWLERSKTERGQRTSFGMRVLSRITDRVVLPGLRVESEGLGETRRLRLLATP